MTALAFAAARFSANMELTEYRIQYFPSRSNQSPNDSTFGHAHHGSWDNYTASDPLVASYDLPVSDRRLTAEHVSILSFIQELALRPSATPLNGMTVGTKYALELYVNGAFVSSRDKDGHFMGHGLPQWPVWSSSVDGLPSRSVLKWTRQERGRDVLAKSGLQCISGLIERSEVEGICQLDLRFFNDAGDETNCMLNRDEQQLMTKIVFLINLGSLLAPARTPLREIAAAGQLQLKSWQATIRERAGIQNGSGIKLRLKI